MIVIKVKVVTIILCGMRHNGWLPPSHLLRPQAPDNQAAETPPSLFIIIINTIINTIITMINTIINIVTMIDTIIINIVIFIITTAVNNPYLSWDVVKFMNYLGICELSKICENWTKL